MARYSSKSISVSDLKEMFTYDPNTGLIRKIGGRHRLGDEPYGHSPNGKHKYKYVMVPIPGRRKVAIAGHRIAWALMTGELPLNQIDHINRDPSDNRWCNLRIATHAQNKWNEAMRKNNTSGFKGVWKCKKTGRWLAAICVESKSVHLGRFGTPEEAAAAYGGAATVLRGSFYQSAQSRQ